jgi:hypothetical protein
MGWHKVRHETSGLERKMLEIQETTDIVRVLANRWFQPLTHVSARGFPRYSADIGQRGKRETRNSHRFAAAQPAAHSVHGAFA